MRALPRVRVTALACAVVLSGLAAAGCADPSELVTGTDRAVEAGLASATATPEHHGDAPEAEVKAPLRSGERYLDVALPIDYRPRADGGGTDDYRCFLVDPALTRDVLVSGVDVLPDNADLVHHVILYRVRADQVEQAQALDAADPHPGYGCFGGSGLDAAPGADLDDSAWLAAWAPGGGERLLADDIGVPLAADSRVVIQMHYNLLGGSGTDRSKARLRISDDDGTRAALRTMLLPAPVELPCREGVIGDLCQRGAAMADVRDRFGDAGATGDRLHVLCGASRPGPVQSCTRVVREPMTVRAMAGHMHLLGRSISVTLNEGQPDEQPLLSLDPWDFDDQGAIPMASPVALVPGDELTVRCTHDQGLRDLLPAFEDAPERYVVWGEGTTDEMCLGIVSFTRG